MKKLIFSPLFILISIVSFSQGEIPDILNPEEIPNIPVVSDQEKNDSIIYEIVETPPEFPGGVIEMLKFIEENFIYPEEAKTNGESGRVYVGFVVYSDGSIGDIKILRSVSPSIDKEAIRVVKAMPNWIPGKQRQKNVNVRYIIPINAKLVEADSK